MFLSELYETAPPKVPGGPPVPHRHGYEVLPHWIAGRTSYLRKKRHHGPYRRGCWKLHAAKYPEENRLRCRDAMPNFGNRSKQWNFKLRSSLN